MTEQPGNRRPITSRQSGLAKATAAWLAKNHFQPNFISILSIAFSLVAFFSFYFDSTLKSNHILFMLLAVVGIQGRLIMNLLDGMVAVEHGKKTIAGGLYNEVPDRISDSFIIIGAGMMVKNMPYAMDMAYVATILAVTTAYIRTLGASLHCGHHFLGPMAKQQRMALLTISCIIAIWYQPVFYYALIIMNIGLTITCYRRLHIIYKTLKELSH